LEPSSKWKTEINGSFLFSTSFPKVEVAKMGGEHLLGMWHQLEAEQYISGPNYLSPSLHFSCFLLRTKNNLTSGNGLLPHFTPFKKEEGFLLPERLFSRQLKYGIRWRQDCLSLATLPPSLLLHSRHTILADWLVGVGRQHINKKKRERGSMKERGREKESLAFCILEKGPFTNCLQFKARCVLRNNGTHWVTKKFSSKLINFWKGRWLRRGRINSAFL